MRFLTVKFKVTHEVVSFKKGKGHKKSRKPSSFFILHSGRIFQSDFPPFSQPDPSSYMPMKYTISRTMYFWPSGNLPRSEAMEGGIKAKKEVEEKSERFLLKTEILINLCGEKILP